MMDVIYLDLTQEQLDEAIAQWKARQNAPMTRADRIRAMTDEELANMLSGIQSFALYNDAESPPEAWLEWLRKEARE